MALRVQRTPLATRQIRQESRWWRLNRTKAPSLFRDELRRVVTLIAEFPDAGSPAGDTGIPDVRRMLMAGTQHYLYYRVREAEARIEVLAVWSTTRGEAPPL